MSAAQEQPGNAPSSPPQGDALLQDWMKALAGSMEENVAEGAEQPALAPAAAPVSAPAPVPAAPDPPQADAASEPSQEERDRLLEEWALAQERAWAEADAAATSEAGASAQAAPVPEATTPAPTTASPVAPEMPGEPVRKLLTLSWPVLAGAAVVLIAAGFGSGALWSKLTSKPVPLDSDHDTSHAESDEKKPPLLEKIDPAVLNDLILEGRYQEALNLCRRTAVRLAHADPAIRYRAALCLEALGPLAEAAALYRSLIVGGPPNCGQTAAQLGLVRVSFRESRTADARAILCDTLLGAADHFFHEHPYLSDSGFLLALSLLDDGQARAGPGPLDPSALAPARMEWPVELYVKWDTPRKRGSQPLPTPAEEMTVSREADVSARRVRAHVPRTAVGKLIDQLAQAAGLRVQWSDNAREAVAGRTARLALEAAPLSEVLRCLTLPHGVGWQMDRAVLSLFVPAPGAASRLAQGREARRALNDALTAAPEHSLAAAAMLELGNLESRQGQLVDAVGWYERLIREHPRSVSVVAAAYNHGLLRYRLGERIRAREALYRGIDQASGNGLTVLCHWWIGRSHLEDLNLEAAERAFRRARTAEADAPAVAAAALGVSATLLLAGNHRAAHETLAQHHQTVTRGAFRTTALFLGAYSRYLADPSSDALSSDLLRALGGLEADPVLGVPGLYLRGQAYARLGLNEQLRRLYNGAPRSLRGFLAQEMTSQLAEQYLAEGRREEARARYAALATQEGAWGTRAQFRLADIHLRDARPDDCLTSCRALLQAKKADRAEVLTLMGRAYQAKGDYRRAARCFAGEAQ